MRFLSSLVNVGSAIGMHPPDDSTIQTLTAFVHDFVQGFISICVLGDFGGGAAITATRVSGKGLPHLSACKDMAIAGSMSNSGSARRQRWTFPSR